MIEFELKHPRATIEHLGLVPEFFSADDPRPAKEQLRENYAHGGGWNPMQGFKMTETSLRYPGDPPFLLLAEAKLNSETLRLYTSAWLAVVQPDGSYEVARVD